MVHWWGQDCLVYVHGANFHISLGERELPNIDTKVSSCLEYPEVRVRWERAVEQTCSPTTWCQEMCEFITSHMGTKQGNFTWDILMNFSLKIRWRRWWADSSDGKLWGMSAMQQLRELHKKLTGGGQDSYQWLCSGFLQRATIHPKLCPALGCLLYWQLILPNYINYIRDFSLLWLIPFLIGRNLRHSQ